MIERYACRKHRRLREVRVVQNSWNLFCKLKKLYCLSSEWNLFPGNMCFGLGGVIGYSILFDLTQTEKTEFSPPINFLPGSLDPGFLV